MKTRNLILILVWLTIIIVFSLNKMEVKYQIVSSGQEFNKIYKINVKTGQVWMCDSFDCKKLKSK